MKDVIKKMGHYRGKTKLPEMYGSVTDYLEHKKKVMEQLSSRYATTKVKKVKSIKKHPNNVIVNIKSKPEKHHETIDGFTTDGGDLNNSFMVEPCPDDEVVISANVTQPVVGDYIYRPEGLRKSRTKSESHSPRASVKSL
jgi:hypothetical protein